MGGNGPPQYPSRQTGLFDGLKGSRGDREEWTSTFYMKLSGRNVGHVWNARMSGRNDRESRNRALYLTRSIFSNSCFLILFILFFNDFLIFHFLFQLLPNTCMLSVLKSTDYL